MAEVVYNGPFEAVDLVLPDGREVVATRGEPIEVPDEVVVNLAKQGWSTDHEDEDDQPPAPFGDGPTDFDIDEDI